jgi:hypothetical protein
MVQKIRVNSTQLKVYNKNKLYFLIKILIANKMTENQILKFMNFCIKI